MAICDVNGQVAKKSSQFMLFQTVSEDGERERERGCRNEMEKWAKGY